MRARLFLRLCLFLLAFFTVCSFLQWTPPRNHHVSSSDVCRLTRLSVGSSVLSEGSSPAADITPKSVTKEIMAHFDKKYVDAAKDEEFSHRLRKIEVKKHIDGMHVITILFQSARTRRKAKDILPLDIMFAQLKSWDREWSERDISTFVYGIRSLECINPIEGKMLKFAADKIAESKAVLSSRAIGNALYGLQGITSDTEGAAELCEVLASKIEIFQGDLNGQDIGIGLYGLQGMSPNLVQVRKLIAVLAEKISKSESEFDAQAMSNALYGLQSMSDDFPEVRSLVGSLAVRLAESNPVLTSQSMGTALYGLQQMSSNALEVRSLLATLAEKIESSTNGLDAQAIGNALQGLQRMKSNSPEVRALVQAIATKLEFNDVQMDSKGIGSALYGLHNMNSDAPQVRALLKALADRISTSKCSLNGQAIADALYGLQGMTYDCPELRALISALAARIDASTGKLDAQEIGNALYGLQGLSSDMVEVRVIVAKLAEKVRRSRAALRPQNIARALLGLQRLSAASKEVRSLLKHLTKRIKDSDRVRMSGPSIADSLYGLQGMESNVPEVQELCGELAKKIASTGAVLSPDEVGRALFGLQGLSSSRSLFEESAIGIDSDEVQFLLSALWDKMKVVKSPMSLSSLAMGMLGITYLKDPIAEKMRQYMYKQIMALEKRQTSSEPDDPIDIIKTMRALHLNNLVIPNWLEQSYSAMEEKHKDTPLLPISRADKIVIQRYNIMYATDKLEANVLLDGFRLDMSFPDIKLDVELDGPTHGYPARARYDRARDTYVNLKKGYEVVRLQLVGKSVDQLVQEIHDKVVERRDRLAEIEIQRMYASEKELQRLASTSNKK